ncbi:MAG: AraC family transcriptional regulator [Pseudomonadota bacterium]
MSDAIAVHHGSFGRAALYRLDKPIVTHAHREGHLIFFLSGSAAKVTVSGECQIADTDRAVAVSPWEPHSFELLEPQGACHCLVLYIKPIWFLESSESAEYALRFGRSGIEVNPAVLRALRLISSLMHEEETPGVFNKYLYELTSRSFQESWAGIDRSQPLILGEQKFTDYRVRRSLRLMQEQFAETLGMDELARQSGLSRPHFFTLFKKQMGVSPNIYLNTLRTERAIQELVNTNKSVTDISTDLGFSSQASFTRFFASNVGIPPTEYRRVGYST